MHNFFENHSMLINPPLDPCEAFFDGRTENITKVQSYGYGYKVMYTKKIRYVNVCSLYPYVLKTGIFPLGQSD